MSERAKEALCIECRHKQSGHNGGTGRCDRYRSQLGGRMYRCGCPAFVQPQARPASPEPKKGEP